LNSNDKKYFIGFHSVASIIDEQGLGENDIFYLARRRDDPQIRRIIQKVNKKNITIQSCKYSDLTKIVNNENHQGIALLKAQDLDLTFLTEADMWQRKGRNIYLAFEAVQDAGNLGAVIRTAVGLEVTAIILPKQNTAPLGSGANKASAGNLVNMSYVRVGGLAGFLERARKHHFLTMGLSTHGQELSRNEFKELAQTAQNIILVFGSEHDGLAQLSEKRCDYLFKLRQQKIESYNLSVSVAISLSMLTL